MWHSLSLCPGLGWGEAWQEMRGWEEIRDGREEASVSPRARACVGLAATCAFKLPLCQGPATLC